MPGRSGLYSPWKTIDPRLRVMVDIRLLVVKNIAIVLKMAGLEPIRACPDGLVRRTGEPDISSPTRGPPGGFLDVAVLYGSGALPRRPHRKINVDATTTMPTLISPAVTRLSCHAWALNPGAVMGDKAPVPKIAASVVKSQFA